MTGPIPILLTDIGIVLAILGFWPLAGCSCWWAGGCRNPRRTVSGSNPECAKGRKPDFIEKGIGYGHSV